MAKGYSLPELVLELSALLPGDSPVAIRERPEVTRAMQLFDPNIDDTWKQVGWRLSSFLFLPFPPLLFCVYGQLPNTTYPCWLGECA